MTDQTIPNVTDDDRRLARKWAENIESDMDTWGDSIRAAVRVILDAVPAPLRPTLADMTPRERRACNRMQADVKGVEARAVIVNSYEEDGKARVMWPGGFNKPTDWEEVTPRRDLPRMKWPGDTSDAVPESTLAVGSEWHDADALTGACEETGRDQIAVTDRDGNVSVWDARRDDWRGHYRAIPKSAPYTIINAGKKDDQ